MIGPPNSCSRSISPLYYTWDRQHIKRPLPWNSTEPPTSLAPFHSARRKKTCPMSLTVLPSRARCIHITDGIVPCHCPWFNAPSLPLQELNCVECGHGIHTHVDYESKVVFHNPATHCAAYAQKVFIVTLCYSAYDSPYSRCRRINHTRVLAPYSFLTMSLS
ncbi:hypothetical protein EDD85DRAFT_495823 [Armillaria nabsnona]|nr:hypothetical protein EDD85DRAFT_495823 [Armillaria nabsnona]